MNDLCKFKNNQCIYCGFILPNLISNLNIMRPCPKKEFIEFPSKKEQTLNFLSAAKDFIISGGQTVTKEQHKQRIEICNTCTARVNNTCALCGCNIIAKASGKVFECPIGKWPEPRTMTKKQHLRKFPILADIYGNTIDYLDDIYRNSSCFLICGGPSVKSLDLSKLNRHGILTMSVNNAYVLYKTNFWISVDTPGNFVDAVFRDPTVMKFIPLENIDKYISTRKHGVVVQSAKKVSDMPNVFTFRRNRDFNSNRFLNEPTVNWGNHQKIKDENGLAGCRSVLLASLRILYYLGIKNVYLLGVDFKMTPEESYAFRQKKDEQACKTNNESYFILNKRLEKLQPVFLKNQFYVYNCNPLSNCKAFPIVNFDKAIEDVLAKFPKEIDETNQYNTFK